MRKAFVSAAVAALIISLSPTPAWAPDAGAVVDQLAFASWVQMHGKTGDFYGVIGWRWFEGTGPEGLVAAFKGKCHKSTHGDMTVISCTGHGRGKRATLENFQMDPALSSARVVVKTNGQKHVADWKGKGLTPTIYEAAGVNPGGAGAGVQAYRNARAKGRVFGRKLNSRTWLDFAVLNEVVAAGVSSHLSTYGIDLSTSGDRLEISRTIRYRS
ncbi:MAG: hypothetical protein M3280_06585 [Actinomycetota bacterium]|nr:hypothetical protein [Actinomycetota bacterium]